ALVGEPAPPQPVVKANDAVVPDESEGVRIEKPRPKPKPEVKQQPRPVEPPKRPPAPEEPRPAPPAAGIVLPYTPVASGVSAQVGVDDANFEFAYYIKQVQSMIGHNWTPPASAVAGVKVDVYFRVARSGSISGLRLSSGSGDSDFDQSALRAVVIT